MRRLVPSIVALVLLVSTAAHADEASTPVEDKDPSVAVLLSLGVTTAGVVTLMASDNDSTAMLGAAAMFLGPSTGRWYAGEAGLGTLALRGLGAGLMFYGLATVLESECDYEDGPCDDNGGTGGLMMIAGAGTWLGSTIADVILAKTDTDHWNRRHALTLSPTLMQGPPGGAGATGLVLRGSW